MSIVIVHLNPPIPARGFDYCAYFEEDEDGGPRGYGPTEQEATADLLAHLDYGETLQQAFEALACASRVLFLLEDEVKALGCNAVKVAEMVRSVLPAAQSTMGADQVWGAQRLSDPKPAVTVPETIFPLVGSTGRNDSAGAGYASARNFPGADEPGVTEAPVAELKPCPFCGGSATADAQFGREWWVECDECQASTGGSEPTREAAAAAWNRRAASGVLPPVCASPDCACQPDPEGDVRCAQPECWLCKNYPVDPDSGRRLCPHCQDPTWLT